MKKNNESVATKGHEPKVKEPTPKPKTNNSKNSSFTQELKEDVKIITHAIKQKNTKVAGIFSLIGAGLWLLVFAFTIFSHTDDFGYASGGIQALTIVSFVLLICATIFLWIAWKKIAGIEENIKTKSLIKRFLLVAILCGAVSLFLQIFYIAGAFGAFNPDYWRPILVLLVILTFTGAGMSITSGILLVTTKTTR